MRELYKNFQPTQERKRFTQPHGINQTPARPLIITAPLETLGRDILDCLKNNVSLESVSDLLNGRNTASQARAYHAIATILFKTETDKAMPFFKQAYELYQQALLDNSLTPVVRAQVNVSFAVLGDVFFGMDESTQQSHLLGACMFDPGNLNAVKGLIVTCITLHNYCF